MDDGEAVLVTGATGLVGYHLVKALKNKRVIALVRDQDPQSLLLQSDLDIAIVNGSLEDESVIERTLCEYEIGQVYHLGAQTIVGCGERMPVATFESNIRGTYLLLEACRRQRDLVKHIVIASSDKAYGTSLELPYREEMPLHGKHPYDVSKSCCDLIAQSYAHTYDMPIAISRCGNIFGEGDQNYSRLIPGTIRSLLRDEVPIIRSDGTFLRDYIYVEDVVSGYLLLAEKRARGAYNFGPGAPKSVLEVVNLLIELMSATCQPIILDEVQNEIRDQYLDSRKARRLGWEPQYTFEQALEKTIAWYGSRVAV
ncbi:MAG: GDP-mannose 4,6-dehydratase [Simkaniaceae bacterium]|nr:GDP-mannose 4,6-dehydratase [Simkaniaceae bacterium]